MDMRSCGCLHKVHLGWTHGLYIYVSCFIMMVNESNDVILRSIPSAVRVKRDKEYRSKM